MHYAAVSPVFNALELATRQISGGLVGPTGAARNFCVRCHSPIGDERREVADEARAAIHQLSELGQEGITCDFCHTVLGPDVDGSLEGDGIANVAIEFAPGGTKRGPIDDPADSPYHAAASIDYIRSSELCGACHDVRFAKPDLIEGRPSQRFENLFTEWAQSPYAFRSNAFQRLVSCQDCHMSLYPAAPPGTYPSAMIAAGGKPDRKHAVHAFTAVSIPLIDGDPRFANVPVQEERRRSMLRAACTLAIEPSTFAPADPHIAVRLTVENVGAGHRVPSGFSQERQVWIHLVVADDAGTIYESGGLVDRPHPETGEGIADGRLEDEDLEDQVRRIDPRTLRAEITPGPDANRRPVANLGLVNFQNAFVRITSSGEHVEVVSPLEADGVDNGRSLAPGVPYTISYDVPWPDRAIRGAIHVRARLRFRSFPPDLMRALAIRHPDLVTEAMVDRNTIVDMAEATAVIAP
jgi:hypothetical protein